MADRGVHRGAVAEAEVSQPTPVREGPRPRVVRHVPVLGQVPGPSIPWVRPRLQHLGQDKSH
eukprot:8490659-Alexandrium_andersonii.AAC.1